MGGRRQGSDVATKGNPRNLCGDGDVLYLDCVNINILVVIL